MPGYIQKVGSAVEARMITKDNKEDITNWCQQGNGATIRAVKIPEIVGDRNIGDYVVKFEFGHVLMAKDIFELFYQEEK